MTDFNDLVKSINGNDHDRLTKPVPKISWTQKDLDETISYIFRSVDDAFKNALPSISKFVESRVKPLRERIDELQRRTDELEHKTENLGIPRRV